MVTAGPFHKIDVCRICGDADLQPVIDLGEQALTGRFPKPDEPDPPRVPLVVVRCTQCGLVQLRHSVATSMMFGENYGYRSGINSTMRTHLSAIATDLARRARLQREDVVLDIGCNDGTLLLAYQVPGLLRVGIDPISEIFRKDYPLDLQVHAGLFTAETYRQTSGRPTARAITSISMFYDLEDPAAFVADIASVLASDGIWVLEQSYLPSMIEQNSFDTICHEHLEYYALAQIERLVNAHGLRIFDASLNKINGGSFQIWVCHEGAPYAPNRVAIGELSEREKCLDLTTDSPYAAFRTRVARIGDRLREFIAGEAKRGRAIYVYGASTKGNVLLQHFGLDAAVIRGCADKNPVKWGRRTPGTGIPIVSEEDARKRADYFLALPWHFRDEFLARETVFRARGGKFIFPLPDVEIC
jgi:NDP-4-keto-2,6-dideoxyhexose 3-C-methyltransferase